MMPDLQQITAVFGINAKLTLADLLSFTPNLTTLNVIIDHPVNATAWFPSAIAFHAIGQLRYFRVLQLRIVTVFAKGFPGQRLFAVPSQKLAGRGSIRLSLARVYHSPYRLTLCLLAPVTYHKAQLIC
jgi:hypothetical protein